ncbi:hypothetical protein OPT61_g1830 [Boeremia exigua]|uniref:Uncharacterized protein n=1 Tax=Boeremia exigua TaxID=749465 RepID=A0ACC2INN5_9PLEO|nr:hypothetical protein OPT61_g1830 [Boeremia exigua]
MSSSQDPTKTPTVTETINEKDTVAETIAYARRTYKGNHPDAKTFEPETSSFKDGTLCDYPFGPLLHSILYEPAQAERDTMAEMKPEAVPQNQDARDTPLARGPDVMHSSNTNPESLRDNSQTEPPAHGLHVTDSTSGAVLDTSFDLRFSGEHEALPQDHFGVCCLETRPTEELTAEGKAARAVCPSYPGNLPPIDSNGERQGDAVRLTSIRAHTVNIDKLAPPAQHPNQRHGLLTFFDLTLGRWMRNKWGFIPNFLLGVLLMLAWKWAWQDWRPWFWTRTPEQQAQWCQTTGAERLLS